MQKAPSIIVFSTQYMPTGGIESHLKEFCYRMKSSGVDIDLVILNSKMLPETEEFFKKNCRRVFLCKRGRSLDRIIWLLFNGIRISGHFYDALYTNGQGESINLFSKLVRHRHTWVHHHHTAGDADDQTTWGNEYKKVLELADTIIACSCVNARNMELRLNRRVKNIPCFSRDASGIIPEKKDRLKFGYYGRLIREKGIDILCSLGNDEDLKEVEIHIWGEGADYAPDFFLGHPNVHYHGAFFGDAELSRIIGQLDAYLLISTHPEGLPISLLEVMSAGLPWLATDRGGIPDIACDPLSTRVIPASSNYRDVKNAVLNLAADINNGRINNNLQKDLYLKKFSALVLVKRWHEVLGLYA
jgi:glycosyltransferase involved in cell wall biosynthesis